MKCKWFVCTRCPLGHWQQGRREIVLILARKRKKENELKVAVDTRQMSVIVQVKDMKTAKRGVKEHLMEMKLVIVRRNLYKYL